MEENTPAIAHKSSPETQPAEESLRLIDLSHAITEIKQKLNLQQEDLLTQVLSKTGGMRLVLIAMRKSAEMKSHVAPGSISVQVLEGQIEFKAEEKLVTLHQTNIMTLEAKITHQVKALENSVLLLSMTI